MRRGRWECRGRRTDLRLTQKEDPTGLAAVYEAVDALATHPRPAGSVPYASPDVRRLHVGAYRVLYVIDDAVIHILVTHLGRTP
ncbi:type II toxin-antitoxin system RelE/ParE family toxin [Streptomyces sp. NPDC023723]|uniref:type II toxin-antitoxin system RelE family toxin n=1 Tax=Streptomyces sp. NPDC023723 TaxID=3154323 RepID=UPI0033D77039